MSHNIAKRLAFLNPPARLTIRKKTAPGATFVIWQVMDGARPVGEICRTGESRDNYPWGWHFYDGAGLRRSTGVADSRANALDAMQAAWKR